MSQVSTQLFLKKIWFSTLRSICIDSHVKRWEYTCVANTWSVATLSTQCSSLAECQNWYLSFQVNANQDILTRRHCPHKISLGQPAFPPKNLCFTTSTKKGMYSHPNWEQELSSKPTLMMSMQPWSVMKSSLEDLSTDSLVIWDLIPMSEVRQETGISRITSPVPWSCECWSETSKECYITYQSYTPTQHHEASW